MSRKKNGCPIAKHRNGGYVTDKLKLGMDQTLVVSWLQLLWIKKLMNSWLIHPAMLQLSFGLVTWAITQLTLSWWLVYSLVNLTMELKLSWYHYVILKHGNVFLVFQLAISVPKLATMVKTMDGPCLTRFASQEQTWWWELLKLTKKENSASLETHECFTLLWCLLEPK